MRRGKFLGWVGLGFTAVACAERSSVPDAGDLMADSGPPPGMDSAVEHPPDRGGGDVDASMMDDVDDLGSFDGESGEFALNFEGRSYFLHVPEAYDASTPIALLIGFHGACTPAEEFWDKDGVEMFRTAAEPANFILVIPETRGGCNSTEGFCNDFIYWPPSCDASDWGPIEGEIEDLLLLIDEIGRHYRLDPKQIHAWGHSNGGIFTALGGFQHTDRFATLSIFAMGWGAAVPSNTLPPRLIPVQFICGEEDEGRVEAAIESEGYLAEQGFPTRMIVVPNEGHGIDDLVEYVTAQDAFDWMRTHPLP